MSSKNYKVPPLFDEKKSYESWKNEVEIWKLVTELDKNKQALAVALSLSGRARNAALEIAAADLNKDNGLTTLLHKLDTVFLKEEKDRQYDAYTEFDNIKRETNVSMLDYIIEFERIYNKMSHYCVNIRAEDYLKNNGIQNEEEILTVTENMTTQEKQKTLLKLHKQFGHASVEKLKRLLDSAGNHDDECIAILKNIVSNCETCIRYCRQKPKPAVGLPMASTYNETVAVDLHELEHGVWYLHAIDHFTRFSAGSIVTTKKPTEIVKHLIHCWISVHGPPHRLFSDNGGEFNNEEMRDMAEKFNIELKTTAAYSPWSNGLLERHNQTLTEILLKIKKDNGCSWGMALDWALMAKNSMHNVHGYSPYQLVFGQNPNMPAVLINKPPALETTQNNYLAQHITTLHAARQAFTEAECSERIQRALRKQLRANDDRYETGDKVYYKRADCTEWKGPGVVIGQDGVVIFVRHGGTYVRVHHSRLRKVDTQETVLEDMETQQAGTQGQTTLQHSGLNYEDDTESLEEMATNDDSPDLDNNTEAPLPLYHPEQGTCAQTDTSATPESLQLKAGQVVSYTDRESGQIMTGKILGRAGKATGKNRDWYNMQYSGPDSIAGTTGSVNLSQMDNVHMAPSEHADLCADSYEEDILLMNDDVFHSAKQAELGNWKRNDVFEEVRDEGQRCISTRWVCTLKETPDGVAPKARLVARGFEEIKTEELPKDSPTCASESLRMIMAIICQRKWQLNSMDIKAAFLQGKELTRNIYIRPPPEAQSQGILWRLKKCVYGLADASLYWYNKVKDTMYQLGAVLSQVDPAVFYWLDDSCNVMGVLACHVDDFVWGGSEMFSTTVIPRLKAAFQVSREEHNTFSYIGIEFNSLNDEIQVQQSTYIQNLQPIPVHPVRATQREASLTDKEIDMLKSKIGQILWVARQTRPDVMCDVSILASSTKHATVQTLHCANKLIRKLKSDEVTLKFQHLGKDSSTKLVVFSDSSMGNLPDGGTQGGHLILLMGENGRFSPICWQSRRIRRVVRSTLAGETLALADGIDNAIFLSTLYSELTVGDCKHSGLPIVCVTDNQSLLDAVKSTKSVTEKRLRLEISNIKELLQSGTIQHIMWSATKEQLADCLTKKGTSALVLLRALSEGVWRLKE
ncbi:uncharacterized protein LOC134100639 [Sardina pilchardus]|uniref:uncharacterized protein LOC134100639 n=1 Tax=Sardina pilchardus TaxID=27697 RepID=UPI002E1554D4